MASVTVSISDEQFRWLQHLAQNSQISVEDLLRASIEDYLACPKNEFAQASSYVLRKNVELYRRLA